MEGELLKWTNYVYGWRERFFVLKGSVLLYYIRRGERPKGKIHLSVCSLNITNNDYRFEIDTGTTIFYLRAQTTEKKDEWVKAIKIAKFEAESKNQNVNADFSCNLNATSRLGNESYNLNTNRFSVLQEDKLTKKINFIKSLTDSLTKLNIDFENFLKLNKQSLSAENNSNLNDFLNTYKKETRLLDSQIDEMKKTLMLFAKDFTKLAEYFGPDDYEKNLNYFENLNTKNATNARPFAESNQKEGNRNEEEKTKQKGICICFNQKNLVDEVIKLDDEEFYSMEDSLNHKIGFLNSKPYPSSMGKKGSIELEDKKPHNDYDNLNKNDSIVFKTKGSKSIENLIGEVDARKPFRGNFYDEAYNNKRISLPYLRKKINLNVWGILKDAVTKDLSKFCVPVYFNEPLSMLQRFCEPFQYAALLNRAAKLPNPYIRLALCAAFSIGSFAFNIYRTLKFFNPLLSETYEYIDNELNFRYFAEQVSHHPAITACYAEGDGYTYYSNSNSAYKFLLMKGCLEFTPTARTYHTFEKFNNELITVIRPKTVCRNLIMGTMHLDTHGKMIVNNQNTGDVLELEIQEESKNERGNFFGEAKDIYGNTRLKLEGNIHSHMDIIYDDESGKEIRETIWNKIKIEGDEEARFYFTDFACNLNNLTEDLKKVLPPSDSRFRPDQRALENQDIDLATSEKLRLEEKQRARRKENEKLKIKHHPLYFEETYDDLTGELIYKYKGSYFEDRAARRFDKFLDLY